MHVMRRGRAGRAAPLLVAVLLVAAPARADEAPARADEAPARADAAPASRIAVRAGWAYGLGVELEYRPRAWGVGASGGYVPGLGAGGYLGVQWGLRPLARSGPVAEAGVFRGVHNPLRVADTGLGVYALAGYALSPGARLSVRVVAGGGVPLDDPAHRPSFELLAKLTAGVVF